MANSWPDHLVDARHLYETIAERLGVNEQDLHGRRAFNKVFSLEKRIEQARLAGQITRFVGKDPATGQVFGYAYKREDIARFVANPTT